MVDTSNHRAQEQRQHRARTTGSTTLVEFERRLLVFLGFVAQNHPRASSPTGAAFRRKLGAFRRASGALGRTSSHTPIARHNQPLGRLIHMHAARSNGSQKPA